MDEILIDEKRYVSSKQAAKMTGYAKDYIGQLCREGRVPARLVGRSWYVLETAIQDHRFGTPDTKQEEESPAEPLAPPAIPWTRESPRYEAVSDEPLPTLNRLRNDIEIGPRKREEEEEVIHAPVDLQNSWKEWFDRIGNAAGGVIDPVISAVAPVVPKEPEREVKEQVQEIDEDEEVNIPIHTIYQAPPEELLPHYIRNTPMKEPVAYVKEEEISRPRRRGSTGAIKAIKVTAVTLAILAASLAVFGSGYADKFAETNSHMGLISGIQVYNK